MCSKRSISRIFSILMVGVFMPALVSPGCAAAASPAEPAKAAEAPAMLQFTSAGHVLGFTSQGMYAATGTHALHVDFVDANAVPPTVTGDSPASTNGQAASLSRVNYSELWKGISLEYSAAPGGVYMTTYSLAPGANVSDIRLGYNAPLSLNKNGVLTIAFETGTLTESAPIAWQEINGQRITVQAAYTLSGNEVGFALSSYDPRRALTIDPTLTWNTFLGAAAGDQGHGIAVDGSGNVYVVGDSWATWGSPVRAFTTGYDAFAAKLNSSGALTWNTFLGGLGSDSAHGIAVDGSGKVYVAGRSAATWGSPVRAYTSSGEDAFAAKLTSAGVLTWNTFLGGSMSDYGYAIAVDGSGKVYVAGEGLSTWGSPVRAFTSQFDAFAAKLTSAGALTWNTFLGGPGYDYGRGIAVDGSGNVYMAGYSTATWGTPVRVYTSGDDAFAAKLNSTGALTWNTFLGGSGTDGGTSIAVDGSGNVYVAGYSFAAWGSPLRAYTSAYDAFAAKLDSSGALTWNTFLGGSANDAGNGIAVDGSSNVYLAGHSYATWGSPVRAYTSSVDGYAAQLDPSGNLIWNTFLGGSGIDIGRGIAVDGSGNAYVAGSSSATWGSPLHVFTSGYEVFVALIDGGASPSVSSIVRADTNPTAAASVAFTVTFSESVTGVDTAASFDDFTLTTTGVTGASITSVSGSGSIYTVTVNTGSGDGTIRLDVVDDNSIVDATSDPLGGAAAGDGNFTAGEAYSINKTLILRSVAANDGWVLESTENSTAGGTLNAAATTFNLGDDPADKQYRSTLQFNTSSLPDTSVITKVTLKIKKQGLVGTDPFTVLGALRVDIRKPFFGAGPGLEIGDFQAPAGISAVATFGVAPVSNWYSALLNVPGMAYVDKTGATQFRLRFVTGDNDNNVADFMRFFSGNAPAASRPQLIIEYYVP